MNKHIFWIVAVAVTICTLSYSVIAQPPGGPGGGRGPGGPGGGPGMGPGGGMGMMMGGGPGGLGMVFQNPEFIKMLELTPAQTDSLRNVMTEIGNDMRTQMEQMRAAGTPPTPDEMRQRMERFFGEVQSKVDQVLKPEQQTKIREVTFQLTGGMNSPMMGVRTLETLNLTDAQKEQVRKITAERDAARMTAMQGVDFRNMTPEDRSKMFADGQARDKQFTDKIVALLTPEQKAKAEKLTVAAPELRQKLGMPEPGQGPGQQRGRQEGSRGPQGPGANSWRPGQEMPNTPSSPNRRGNFPRPSGNSEN